MYAQFYVEYHASNKYLFLDLKKKELIHSHNVISMNQSYAIFKEQESDVLKVPQEGYNDMMTKFIWKQLSRSCQHWK
jgi:hypothetical protein